MGRVAAASQPRVQVAAMPRSAVTIAAEWAFCQGWDEEAADLRPGNAVPLAGHLQVMPNQTFDPLNLSGHYTRQLMLMATSLTHPGPSCH